MSSPTHSTRSIASERDNCNSQGQIQSTKEADSSAEGSPSYNDKMKTSNSVRQDSLAGPRKLEELGKPADKTSGEQVRIVKLRQNESSSSRFGFSLRGGKESTGSSVGVFVSHVELDSEAAMKGLKVGDQLVQVNGLSVNQATYEEVVELIKAAPKRQDIVLWVRNLGRIPVQESAGEPIRWLQVDQASSLDPPLVNYQTDDSAVSSGSLGSTGRSACSLSSISSPSEDSYTASDQESDDIELVPESLVCVPGGRKSSESFGCAVVKGPVEWPGIFVQSVKSGSLAERVGLAAGDQLTRADGHMLVELPFELAISLIKRLQQQQDELRLHVRRGAALKHLASRAFARPKGRSELPADSGPTANEGTLSGRLSPAKLAADKRQQEKEQQQQARRAPTKPISDTQSQLSEEKAAQASPASLSSEDEDRDEAEDGKSDGGCNNNADIAQARPNPAARARSAIKASPVDPCQSGAIKVNIIKSPVVRPAIKMKSPAEMAAEPANRQPLAHRAKPAEMVYQSRQKAQPIGEQRQSRDVSDQEAQEVELDEDSCEEQVKILGQSCKLHHYSRRQLAAIKASRGAICESSCRALQEHHFPPPTHTKLHITSEQPDPSRRPMRRQLVNAKGARRQPAESRQTPRAQPVINRLNRYLSMESVVESSALCQTTTTSSRQRFRYLRSSSTSRQLDLPVSQQRSSSVLGQPLAACCSSQPRSTSRPAYRCPPEAVALMAPSRPTLSRYSRACSVDRLNQLVQHGGDLVAANYMTTTLALASASARRATAGQKQLPANYCCLAPGCNQGLLVYHNQPAATTMISKGPSSRRLVGCCKPAPLACCPAPARVLPECFTLVPDCCAPPCERRGRGPLAVYAPPSLCNLKPCSSSGTESGYLSGPVERRRQARSSSQPRLVRLCTPGSRAPPPPPPPMVTCQQLSQRQTRQHLSTFLSPTSSSSSSSSASAASYGCNPLPSGVQTSPPLSSPTFSTGGSASSSSCASNSLVSSVTAGAASVVIPPRPPPPPGREPEAERKVSRLVERSSPAPAPAKGKERLCFVDELKLLAKRQPSNQGADSSTLIKIINASRANNPICCAQTRAGASTGDCPKAARCVKQQCKPEMKSVKLNEQDNKRRQHELLMKEFKSAHSRMFSRRRNLDELEKTGQKATLESNQVVEDNDCDTRNESRTADLDSNNNQPDKDSTDCSRQQVIGYGSQADIKESSTGPGRSPSAAIKTLNTKRKLGAHLLPVSRVAAAN